MKKNIYIVLTLILSLFVCCNRVYANNKIQADIYDYGDGSSISEYLVCIYEGGETADATKIVEMTDGSIYVYTSSEYIYNPSNTEVNWKSIDKNLTNIIFDTYYLDDEKMLTSCPNYTRYSTRYDVNDLVYTFYFYDKKELLHFDYPLYWSSNDDITSENGLSVLVDNGKKIEDTEWDNKCAYCSNSGCLYLYYNDENFIVENFRENISTSNSLFDIRDIRLFKENGVSCPSVIYETYIDTTNPFDSVISADYTFWKRDGWTSTNNTTCFDNNNCISEYGVENVIPLYENYSEYEIINDNGGSSGNIENPNNCGDLFGDELVKLINDIMNVIRIAVPILLIVLGIVDFTKAVFSGDDKAMSKAQSTFIKRIVAAVIVFLVPIFVNLVLNIANEVWDYISLDTCIE